MLFTIDSFLEKPTKVKLNSVGDKNCEIHPALEWAHFHHGIVLSSTPYLWWLVLSDIIIHQQSFSTGEIGSFRDCTDLQVS